MRDPSEYMMMLWGESLILSIRALCVFDPVGSSGVVEEVEKGVMWTLLGNDVAVLLQGGEWNSLERSCEPT